MVKYNLVFFFSEGTPNDNGQSLSHNKDKLLEIAKPHFDNISWYTPKKLRDMGYGDYVKEREPGHVRMNPGMSYIGNCAWRPLIMLLELEKMEEGDILVYRDSNVCGHRANQLSYYDDIRNIIDKCLSISKFDFFVPFEGKGISVMHAKTNVIRELGEDHLFSYNFPNVFSGLLTIARKSNISIHFLSDWKHACENEEWIDGKTYGELDSRFRWQCPEQSILGIIISKWIRKQQYNISPYYPNIVFGSKIIKNICVIKEDSSMYSHLKYLNFENDFKK